MASLALAFDILAKDKASRTFANVGDSADRTGRKLSSLDVDGGRALGNLGSKFAALGKAAALGVGALAVGGFALAKTSISAASDLGESMSKVNVVFGEGAVAVQAWSKTAAESLGMSQQAALEAAGTFGNFLIAMGSTREVAQDMSIGMVELAADLASFNNANPDDVLLALRAGLSGEAEPLRKFGVSLSSARVEAEALAAGLVKPIRNAAKMTAAGIAVEKANLAAATAMKKHGKESLQYREAVAKVTKAEEAFSAASEGKIKDLTAADKAQAAYLIITKDTALAQGDFARTSDGLANKQRILSAKFTDLQASIGQGLLPVALAIADFFTDKLLPILERYLPDALEAAGRFFTDAGKVVGEFVQEKLELLRAWWDENGPEIVQAAKDIADIFKEKVVPALEEFVDFVVEDVVPMLGDLITWLAKNETAAIGAMIAVGFLVAAWVAATAPVTALVLLILGLGAATSWFVGLPEFGDLLQWVIDMAGWAKKLAEYLARVVTPLGAAIGLAKGAAGLLPDLPGGAKEATVNPLTGLPVKEKEVFARAMGGPVSMGSAYMVGERGPELFMPGSSGSIIPNTALSGFDAVGEDQLLTQRQLVGLVSEQNGILRAMGGGTITRSRSAAAVMG